MKGPSFLEADKPAPSIVAVHGLDGHRESTWTAENGVLWLKALLSAKTSMPSSQNRTTSLGLPSVVYDPAIRMETLTNCILLQTVQALKRWIGKARGGQPLIDWHFMQLMRVRQ